MDPLLICFYFSLLSLDVSPNHDHSPTKTFLQQTLSPESPRSPNPASLTQSQNKESSSTSDSQPNLTSVSQSSISAPFLQPPVTPFPHPTNAGTAFPFHITPPTPFHFPSAPTVPFLSPNTLGSCCRQQQIQSEISQVYQQLQVYQYQLQKQQLEQRQKEQQQQQKQHQNLCLPSIFYFPPSPSQSPSPLAHAPILGSLYSPSLSDQSTPSPSPMQFTFPAPTPSPSRSEPIPNIDVKSVSSIKSELSAAASLAQNVMPVVSNVSSSCSSSLAQDAFSIVPILSSCNNNLIVQKTAPISSVPPLLPFPSTSSLHLASPKKLTPNKSQKVTIIEHTIPFRSHAHDSDKKHVVVKKHSDRFVTKHNESDNNNTLFPVVHRQDLQKVSFQDKTETTSLHQRRNISIPPVTARKKLSLVPILTEQESSFILSTQKMPLKSQSGSQIVPIRPPKGPIPLTLHPHVTAAMGRSSSTPGLVESSGRVPLEEMWVSPVLKLPTLHQTSASTVHTPAVSPSARLVFFLFFFIEN